MKQTRVIYVRSVKTTQGGGGIEQLFGLGTSEGYNTDKLSFRDGELQIIINWNCMFLKASLGNALWAVGHNYVKCAVVFNLYYFQLKILLGLLCFVTTFS